MSVKNSKINEIIEDIINQNKVEFNKKTRIQQDKEKDTMSEVIEKSLVGLNNYERTIILIELFKSVHSSSKSFFDSRGNININELIEITNTTIKTAEKDGIIVTNQQSVERNNLKEVVLTVAIIDRLINNYNELSFEEKENLWNNYKNLSDEDKKRLVDSHINELEDLSQECEENGDNENQEILKTTANAYKRFEELSDKANESKEGKQIFLNYVCADENFIKYCKKNNIDFNNIDNNNLKDTYITYKVRFSRIYAEVLENTIKLGKESDLKKQEEIKNNIVKNISNDEEFIKQYKKEHPDFDGRYQEDLASAYNNYYKNTITKEEHKQEVYLNALHNESFIEQYKKEHPDFDGRYSENLINAYVEYKSKSVDEISSDFNKMSDEKSEENNIETQNISESLPKVNEEIKQIPIALKNAGFTEEEIKEGLAKYKESLESFDEETLEEFNNLTSEEISAGIKEGFEDMVQEEKLNSNVGKILGLMAGITYHGNIKEVLIDSEKREKFFSELEEVSSMDFEGKATETITEQTEQQFTDDELKQVFNEYFKANSVEMDVSAIEMQSEKAEVVETFDKSEDSNGVAGLNQDDVVNSFNENMESVSDEDNATQGSTSSGAKKFSLNEVKAVASGVKMPEIQDSTQLIREELNKDLEKEEEQEVQTV